MSDTQIMQRLIGEIARRRNIMEERLGTRDASNCTQAIYDELTSILHYKNLLFSGEIE